MDQRPALKPGEDGGVNLLGVFRVIGEHDAAARSAEGFMRRRSDDIGMGHWRGDHAASDEPREMRHIDHEDGPDSISDSAEALEIEEAGIGGAAGDDELRLMLLRGRLDLIHIDEVRLSVDPIADGVEPAPREVDRGAMREVTARLKIEPEDGIAGFEEREEDRLVGLAPRMRLNIRELGAVKLLQPLDGEPLDAIGMNAASIIAAVRISLGVFIGKDRALRLEHGL